MDNLSDLKTKICSHVADADVGDVSYYRYFTGNGTEYYLVCEECSKKPENLVDNLREVLCDTFSEYDNYLFTCNGIKGYPQIKSRKTQLRFEHVNVRLNLRIDEKVLDYKPLDNCQNCEVIALTESFRLIKIDLKNYVHIELCRISSNTQIDITEELSLKLSKQGDLSAIVNTKGQHGVVIDNNSGRVLMQLDRGDYCNDASIFPVEFIEWKGQTLIIHGTEWNKLNISDPITGEMLTKRELAQAPKIAEGKFTCDHYLDYFHASILASENYEWVVDNGWVWHPVGEVVTWSIKRWLEDNIWESEDGQSRKVLCYRNYYWEGVICWIDANRVAVYGFGDDDNLILPAVRVFDVISGKELFWFVGPDNWLIFDAYLFSSASKTGMKVWDINTGELLHVDKTMHPQVYHKGAKTFVTMISENEFKLSRLIT